MKIAELIQELSELHPDLDVMIEFKNEFTEVDYVGISRVLTGGDEVYLSNL